MTTRVKGKKQLVEMDTDGDEDEHDEEETSEVEQSILKRRKVKTITLHAISQLVTFSPYVHICMSIHEVIFGP